MFNTENNETCGIIYINEKHYLSFQCSNCEYIIDSFENLTTHLTDHYKEVRIGKDCDIEQEDTRTNSSEMMTLECMESWESFSQKEDYTLEHNVDIESCSKNVEGEERSDHENFYDVINTEEEHPEIAEDSIQTKEYPLLDCNKKVADDDEMINPFQCTVCGSIFKDKYILGNHVLRHTGKKDFPCSQCPKKFYTRTEVKLHERCHNNERPYLCTFCGKTFVTTSNMFKHMKRHNTTRPHKCDICGKGFHDKPDLWHHLPIHSDVRAFCCNKCPATFKQQKSLQAHMKIHLNKREYRCKLCGASFNQGPGLRSHLKSKHRIEEHTHMD